MSRRSVILPALVFIVATSAFGYRPRPVSDLRFDDRAPIYAVSAATDGSDFLVLGSTNDDPLLLGRTSSRVFVQRVVDGVPVGPQLGIGVGAPGRVAWVGTHYLASWVDDTGLFVAAVSRDGNVLSLPSQPVFKVAPFHFALFAANQHSAVAVNESTIQPLDLAGAPTGAPIPLPPSPPNSFYDNIAALGDGFALTFTGYGGTGVMRLARDGAPVTATPTVVDAAAGTSTADYSTQHAVAAGIGTDAVVLYERGRYGSGTELKTAVVDDRGVLTRGPQLVLSSPIDRALDPAEMVWDGSEYVAALAVSHDPTGNFEDVDPALLRISSGGDVIGGLNYAFTGPRRQVPTALAFNGRELLVPWYDVTNQNSYGSWVAAVSLSTMQPSQPRQIGRSVDRQTNVAVGAMNGQYLAAWIETTADTRTVRASRIDASGNYLDGPGIVLSATAAMPKYSTVDVASDGINWFIVWANGGVRGARLSTRGELLDRVPLLIAPGNEAAVCWNGTNYLVAATDASLYSVLVSRDGAVGPQTTLARWQDTSGPLNSGSISWHAPSLATLNGRFLLTFERESYNYYIGTPGGFVDELSVVGLRLDSAGYSFDAAPFPIDSLMWPGRPAVATDGSRYLVVWAKGEDLAGILLSTDAPQEGGTPFTIDAKSTLPAVAFDGQDFVIAWQRWSTGTLATTRVRGSVIFPPSAMALEPHESVGRPSVAAAPGMHALIGFDFRHDAYGGASRAGLLFGEGGGAVQVPAAPAIAGATRADNDTITVRWQPVTGAFGIAIELRFDDGTYREIGVAPGGATSGRASLAGLEGTAIRIRAWNSAGVSLPSADVPIINARVRAAGRR